MKRLTAEREAQIRCHADAHKPCDDDFHALLAELDAVRAERDGSKRGGVIVDRLTDTDDYYRMKQRANRAEATLAAICDAIEHVIAQAVPRPPGGQQVGAQKYQMTISTAKELRWILTKLDAPTTETP